MVKIEAVLYARVSSKEQEKEGFSIPAQIDLLNKYARKKNIKIIKEFVEAESAKEAGRTKFNEMIKYIKKNKNISAILVEKTDRLYRNSEDPIYIFSLGIDIHFVKENKILNKTSNSNDLFIHDINIALARRFINNLSEETKKGVQRKIEEGYFNAKPPYGYKKIDKKISVIDINAANFVKRAFELYAKADISLKNLRKILYEEGYIYRTNYPKISVGQLEAMLKNEEYMGFIRHHGKLYEGKHQPIISNRLFNQVQLAFKKDNKPKTQKDRIFLYSGLIKCEECGRAITSEIKRNKFIYYHCTGNYGKCKNKKNYVREEIIDEQIKQGLEKVVIDDSLSDYLNKILEESYKDLNIITKEKHNYIKKEISQIKTRQDKLLGLYIDGDINKEIWNEKNKQYTEQIIELEKQISSYKGSNFDYINKGKNIIELAKCAYRLYHKQNTEEKRKMLKILFSNTTLNGRNLSYEYNMPFSFFVKISKNKENYP